MKKLLAILVCIFTIVAMGSCANTSATFDVQTLTLDGKIEWFGEGKYAVVPYMPNSFYLDDDGTFVAVWIEDNESFEKHEIRHYLLRISPDGSYTKTLIYDSGIFDMRENFLSVDSFVIYKNPRGNTVLYSIVIQNNPEEYGDNGQITYVFTEFDYDFNQVKKTEHSEAWNLYTSQIYIAMDDNGYFYTGSYKNAYVYSPDFEYLGEITGLPGYIDEDDYNGEHLVPITGGDGAVYIYQYTDEDPYRFYKIDPQTLSAKNVFSLAADEIDEIWRGDMREGALFYTAGELPEDKYDEGGLIKINKNGSATRLMYWEEADIGVGFSGDEYKEYTFSQDAQFSHDGDFYKFTTADSDGNDETEGDEVIKLISFIRNWE
jgi:hypothetical protein